MWSVCKQPWGIGSLIASSFLLRRFFSFNLFCNSNDLLLPVWWVCAIAMTICNQIRSTSFSSRCLPDLFIRYFLRSPGSSYYVTTWSIPFWLSVTSIISAMNGCENCIYYFTSLYTSIFSCSIFSDSFISLSTTFFTNFLSLTRYATMTLPTLPVKSPPPSFRSFDPLVGTL